ncbi:hypothetical protein NL676_003114 [Syzygium grande]|nr:hypothetical protein NL676_003114 [Syzygium grande]
MCAGEIELARLEVSTDCGGFSLVRRRSALVWHCIREKNSKKITVHCELLFIIFSLNHSSSRARLSLTAAARISGSFVGVDDYDGRELEAWQWPLRSSSKLGHGSCLSSSSSLRAELQLPSSAAMTIPEVQVKIHFDCF